MLAICQNWSLQCFTAAFLNFLKDEKNMLAQLISFKHEETHTTTQHNTIKQATIKIYADIGTKELI